MRATALSRYVHVARVAARQQWTYRAELALRSISMVLFMGVFIALWHTAYGASGIEQLAGYTLAEIIWYLGMAETLTLSTSRIFLDISEEVKAGQLAYKLIRPMPYPLFQLAQSLGNSAPRLLFNFATAVIVVALGTGKLVGSPAGLAAFAVMAALGLVLDALVAVLIGLMAFWIEEVTPVYLIYQKLVFSVGGLFLPLEVFPAWLARIARALPFQLIAYAPARAFVAFEADFVGRALLGQLAYIAALLLVVAGVWRVAQRRMVIQGG